jgi:hypothetical protein
MKSFLVGWFVVAFSIVGYAAMYSNHVNIVDGKPVRKTAQLGADVESVTWDIPGHGKTTVFLEGTRIHVVAHGDQSGGRNVVVRHQPVRWIAGNYVTVGHEK